MIVKVNYKIIIINSKNLLAAIKTLIIQRRLLNKYKIKL